MAAREAERWHGIDDREALVFGTGGVYRRSWRPRFPNGGTASATVLASFSERGVRTAGRGDLVFGTAGELSEGGDLVFGTAGELSEGGDLVFRTVHPLPTT
jgi:hypothetical protein